MNDRPEMADQVVALSADIPLGRYAEPDEIAGPVIFLLSSAARYCTGVDLLVDGGSAAGDNHLRPSRPPSPASERPLPRPEEAGAPAEAADPAS